MTRRCPARIWVGLFSACEIQLVHHCTGKWTGRKISRDPRCAACAFSHYTEAQLLLSPHLINFSPLPAIQFDTHPMLLFSVVQLNSFFSTHLLFFSRLKIPKKCSYVYIIFVILNSIRKIVSKFAFLKKLIHDTFQSTYKMNRYIFLIPRFSCTHCYIYLNVWAEDCIAQTTLQVVQN